MLETYTAQRPSRSYGDLPLSDVTHAAWTVVATSPEPGQWNYLLSPRDVTLLRMARDSGKLVTVMVRVSDEFELRARAVRAGGGERGSANDAKIAGQVLESGRI